MTREKITEVCLRLSVDYNSLIMKTKPYDAIKLLLII